ncbi:hypothetical protein HY993_03445 [Candidatus Micrarchaeota archaeon]|nr:hypothetical protein [Candidatus Micrarchaeota archaeon]
MGYGDEKNLARKLVLQGGRMSLEGFGQLIESKEKQDNQDIVTKYDKMIEEFFCQELAKEFPQIGFIGEEGANDRREKNWVIDPIDGTSYYARGLHDYSVNLSLVGGEETLFGFTYCPAYGELFEAEIGKGAFCNGRKISASKVGKIGEVMFSFGFYDITDNALAPKITRIAQKTRCTRKGPCAREICLVACGKVDLLIKSRQNIWDFAAGKLIVEEAGGKITDFNGKTSFDWSGKPTNNLIITNKVLHEQFLKELA